MALPQLTDEQRKAALEKAAAARHARAELREKIKKGEITLDEVLDSEDPIAARMKVSALIESLPGYGKAKAAKIMNELGISPSRRVKGLGARQREQRDCGDEYRELFHYLSSLGKLSVRNGATGMPLVPKSPTPA